MASSMSWLFPTNLRCLPTVGLNKSLISSWRTIRRMHSVQRPSCRTCGCWHTFRRVVRVDGEPAPPMIHKINEAQRGALNVNRTVWRSLDSEQLLPVFTQDDFVHRSNPHSTCVCLWYLICLFRLERTLHFVVILRFTFAPLSVFALLLWGREGVTWACVSVPLFVVVHKVGQCCCPVSGGLLYFLGKSKKSICQL